MDLLVLVELAERLGKPHARLRDARVIPVEVRDVVEDLLLVVGHHRLEKDGALLDAWLAEKSVSAVVISTEQQPRDPRPGERWAHPPPTSRGGPTILV